MAFTVGIPGGTRNDEYEAYVRLLEKSGVNVAETSRVAEPVTGKRWLYAWASKGEADHFAARLREETGNPDWEVYDLPGVVPSAGPLGPVVILIGRQSDGLSYTLSPSSKKLIWKKFPTSNIAPSVFISTTTQSDFEGIHGSIWEQVAIILTGLSSAQIEQLGGYQIYDPVTRRILHESVPLGV
jgi:hypothetical protein